VSRHDHHQPCPCGAELADECQRCMSANPLGSMRVEPAIGSNPIAAQGLRNVRAALGVAPRTRRDRDDDPNPTRARAIARARTDRTNAKETQ